MIEGRMEELKILCDIIIPVWDQWPQTESCLTAVKEKTRVPFRLILIDNGSGEEARKGLEAWARNPSLQVILLRNETNLGFVKAVNQGLSASSAPYVCLLNNDVIVTHGWLEKMIHFAEKQADAGLVNCLQNEDPGRKRPEDVEAFARTQVEAPHTFMELDHCTGTCLLMKRKVIQEIGYLDEQFGLGHWEDNDYSRRAQQAGYRCLRLLDTYVWHDVGSSFKKIPRWTEEGERNQDFFYQKWGQPLRVLYPVSEGLDFRRARFQQILQTTHALARNGCEVDFIIGKNNIPVSKEAFPHYGLTRHQNLRVHEIPMLRMEEKGLLRFSWSGIFHLGCLLKMRSLLETRAYDAIYVRHLNLANFLLGWKPYLKLPIIFEAHEIFFQTTERKEKKGKIRAQEGRLFSRVDGIVAVSRGLAQDIREIFSPKAPIEVIPGAVHLKLFTEEGRPRKKGKVVYVGQLYGWKGVGNLIEAVRYLPEEELHFIGGGKERVQELRAKTKEMGVEDRIIFHGQISPTEVRKLLADAAVAVLPLTRNDVQATRYTSPLKLFEYMAAGVPIVASDLPSVREILTDGVNALLVEPDNPQALAQGVRQIVAPGLGERLAKKAKEDVLNYTWDRRAERLTRFLRSLKEGKC